MTSQQVLTDLEGFISGWKTDPADMKKAFLHLKDHLFKKDNISFDFKGRKGVSYSLRAKHDKQTNRDLFVMVDVIDDDPEERWLSVCFYGDLLTDPGEKGDLVPEGLAGDDGYCFDLDEYTGDGVAYIEARLDEAFNNAGK